MRRIAAYKAGIFLTAVGLIMCVVVSAGATCKAGEEKRTIKGIERTVVTLENDMVIVEVLPELAGQIVRYEKKKEPGKLLSRLDDYPYHYMCRWEGQAFTHRLDETGPDAASVTVSGGGKIAVSHLRDVLGTSMTSPLELGVERTMLLEAGSTRLKIDVKITNNGQGVAPDFRYMVHAVYEFEPLPDVSAYWFIPTEQGVEVFSGQRNDMWAATGAPVDHPFSRFTPGRKADKPRFVGLGWSALKTASGHMYIYYDPSKTDFMQYWFGGYGKMFTFEPHSKPVDLKPGESTTYSFALSFSAQEVPFTTKTTSFKPTLLPEETTPGSVIPVVFSATTVRDAKEKTEAILEIKDPDGKTAVSRTIVSHVEPFVFTDRKVDVEMPEDAVMGKYAWSVKDAADGNVISSGTTEIVDAAELAKRKTERATAGMKKNYESQIEALKKDLDLSRKMETGYKNSMDLLLGLDDATMWPAGEALTVSQGVEIRVEKDAVPVLGQWKGQEQARITELKRGPKVVWPAEPESILQKLGGDRAFVRDVVSREGGRELVALLVNGKANKVEVVRLNENGVVHRFGNVSVKPGEADDSLGLEARSLAVDNDGNIWVATDAWGQTSVFLAGPDGQPSEQTVDGRKGAVKKYAPDGRLLGVVSMLQAPMALKTAEANGKPVVLVSYRHVSSYHGAQVREGVVAISVAEIKRVGEIKVPAGSLDVDGDGHIWVGDVAGHVSCHTHEGSKILDLAGSPEAAVPDSQLPSGSPLPAAVRCDGEATVWVLYTLQKELVGAKTDGTDQTSGQRVPDDAGVLHQLKMIGQSPVAVGEAGCWKR